MHRPQFTIRTLLVATLAAACFFGGIRFEREWQRRKERRLPPTGVLLQTQGQNVDRVGG